MQLQNICQHALYAPLYAPRGSLLVAFYDTQEIFGFILFSTDRESPKGVKVPTQ